MVCVDSKGPVIPAATFSSVRTLCAFNIFGRWQLIPYALSVVLDCQFLAARLYLALKNHAES